MPSLTRSSIDRHIYTGPFQDLPVDVLPHILAQLSSTQDWYSCALVNRLFNRMATPLLYRTLDSRVISKTLIYHPLSSLLLRPKFARYVRHVTETGAIHFGMLDHHPDITKDTLAALSLCQNLCSLTWVDDGSSTPETLLAFINVVQMLPLRVLTIRTHNSLSEDIWLLLLSLTGVTRLSLWCMNGPPPALEDWDPPLAKSLTHLELGVNGFSYPPLEFFKKLPHLEELRLKGAPASTIPSILACLPSMHTFDTEYLPMGPNPQSTHRSHRTSHGGKGGTESTQALPLLRHLALRMRSMDPLRTRTLWQWMQTAIMPYAGLETLRLYASEFVFVFPILRKVDASLKSAGGDLSLESSCDAPTKADSGPTVPPSFLLALGAHHGATLTVLELGDAQITLGELNYVCVVFAKLSVLRCAVACTDAESLLKAISPADQLTELKLKVQWLQTTVGAQDDADAKFTLHDAWRVMNRSNLRLVSIGNVQYSGKWVSTKGISPSYSRIPSEMSRDTRERRSVGTPFEFVVCADVVDERWKT